MNVHLMVFQFWHIDVLKEYRLPIYLVPAERLEGKVLHFKPIIVWLKTWLTERQKSMPLEGSGRKKHLGIAFLDQ
jgi:hypothetical protein